MQQSEQNEQNEQSEQTQQSTGTYAIVPPRTPKEWSASDRPLWARSAVELANLIRDGKNTAREVVLAHLDRIDQVQPALNCFTVIAAEQALAAADAADKTTPRGPLHGVPVAIKDYTPTAGMLTTRGSVAFAQWTPAEDAPVVERLTKAGAIVIGKTTTAEFAHASFTRSTLWGVTRNPHDLTKTSGGSSGGAGAAVAAGCVPLAEGTDSGGSVRIPASCCGIYGLKPSHGRIPAHSGPNDFDRLLHHGPLARTVDDLDAFLAATAGPDDRDPMSLPAPYDPASRIPLERLRVAVSTDLGHCRVDPTIASNLRRTCTELSRHVATVDEVLLDWDTDVSTAWVDLWSVTLAADFGTIIDDLGDRAEPSLRRLVQQGRRLDGLTVKAIELIQTRAWAALRRVFEDFDVLLCPTLAVPVPPAEGCDDDDWGHLDDEGRVVTLDMAAPFNLVAACPVLSVPNGVDDAGLPTGVQVVGHRFEDAQVLAVGRCLEQLASSR